ncbi:probable serine/threonine-protein kinase PBL28 [Oryza brachyantha]|uniref:Protein kinase domain-containing protein n=1 Tax=Oryza brachyantha TaxID=4533 RepID=J3NA27_ORYBR|nr:probable serine/threonine-protein kinase PBL28 [Oryza brachyantha]XP_040384687.1 probable serine/threonine-protein kinase PBL28 [Oryza brachyantha]
MALWGGLGQAATVAQLVGADVGGLISMIIRAALTAQQNKKECEQLARRVFTIAELLQHLQDPEVLRRRLTGLDDTLREAHELVMACQEKNAVYRLVMAGRQADKFRDVQSRIDSYLLLFPVISHIDITRRLERIYNILVPNDTAGGPSASVSMTQIPAQASQIDWKEPREVKKFTFKELAKATSNFSPDRIIGQGGFGRVYMGYLPDGREVAIKRMDTPYRIEELKAEVTILHSISHNHIVRLFGSCVLDQEKRRLLPPFRKTLEECLLVYEYIENGSLHHHLNGATSPSPVTTSWKRRIEILLGVSRAIEYLQSYAERPVIHRDVKSSNILLDASWAPLLTDFGLALPWEGPDHEVDVIRGTSGYLAPEYVMTGALNLTTDIYNFGVVILEVLTGKTVFSIQELQEEENEGSVKQSIGLTSMAVQLIEEGKLRKVLDKRPAAEPTARQLEAAELVAQTAVRCVQLQWEERPAISEVVAILETALELARCDG